MSLDLRQVQYFLATAQCGSLVRAAAELGVSQPALTTGLRRLERQLGVQLLDRTRSGSTLTGFGSAFVPHAQAIVEAARRAKADFDQLRIGEPARIGVGCGPTLALSLVPTAIAQLRARRVAATFRIVEGTLDALLPLLERGDIDLAVGTASEDLELRGLFGIPLFREPVGIVAARGHALAADARAATLARCRDCTWVLPPASDRMRRWLDERFAAEGLAPPEPVVETGSLAVIRALLLDAGFVSVLPLQAIGAGSGGGDGVCELRLADASWQRTVSVVHRPGVALAPAARRFIDCLQWAAEAVQR